MPRKNLLGGQASGSAFSLLGNRSGGRSSRTYSGTQAEKLAQARADDLPPQQPNSRKEATRELVRLLTTDDPKAQAAGKKAAAEGGFDAKTAAALGALIPVEGGGVADRALKVAGLLLKPVEVIGRPAQAVQEIIQAGVHDLGLEPVFNGQWRLDEDQRPVELGTGGPEGFSTESHNGGPSAAEIMGDGPGSGGYRDAWRALKGEKRWDPVSQKYTHDLQYVAALGADPDAIGKVGNVAGFIGGAALDPLNFVGAGEARAAAKVGEKGAALLADDAARELTPALARQLERQGVEAGAEKIAPEALQQALKRTGIRSGTTAEQRALIRQALIDEAEAGAGRTTKGIIGPKRTVALRGDRATRRGVRALTGKGERTGAERGAEDAIDSAMRYDRGGVRVAGRSVVPEGLRAPVRGLIKDDIRQVGSKFAAPAVIASATTKVDDLERVAQRQAELAGKAEVRRAAVVAKKIDAPAAKLEQEVEDAYSALSEARLNVGSGMITPDSVPPEVKELLSGISYQLDDAGMRARMTTEGAVRGGAPAVPSAEASYLPFASSIIGDHTDEFRKLLREDNYQGLLDLLDNKVLPTAKMLPTWGAVPLKDVKELSSAAAGALKPIAAEAVTARKVATRAVRDAKRAAEKAQAMAEYGVKVDKKTLKRLDLEAVKAAAYAEKSVAAADKADALRAGLEGGSAEELLKIDPNLGNVQTPVVSIVPRKIAPGVRPVEGMASKVREAFINRAGIERSQSLVPGTADDVRASQITAAGTTKQTSEQGRRLMNQAAAVVDGVPLETQREILKALDIGGSLDDLLPTLDDAGRQYATKLDELRKFTYDINIKEKLADVLKFRKRDDYMARYVTKEASEALDKLSKLNPTAYETVRKYHTGKAATSQGGHKLARTVDPNTPLLELNEIVSKPLREAGLLKEGQNALELDPLKIIARRFDQTMPDLQFVRSVEDMSKSVKGTLGEDLVVRIPPGAKVSDRDFTRRGLQEIPIDSSTSGRVFAHPDIAPEISNLASRTVDDAAVEGFKKVIDQWNRLWKSYATVPVITGTGFHTKNSIGNMFNNHLAGIKSYAYKEAFDMQKDIWQAKRAHPDLSVPDALAANGVDADRIAKVELALENQVLDEGFFNTDLREQAELAIEGKRGSAARGGKAKRTADWALSKSNPANPERMWGVPTGRKVGEHIEDNARLSHFISKLDETGDAAQAAASVRKYLFDYGDLTPFERKVMKRIHAFYTFTRKNTPLQFEELIRNPAAANRLVAKSVPAGLL